MKHSSSVFFLLLLFVIRIMACTTDATVSGTTGPENKGNTMNDSTGNTAGNRLPGGSIRIRIGSGTFRATLLNNATVAAFNDRLPMTVSMSELNGNEKLYRFADNPNAGPLPTSASNPGTIHAGDLMLYGANTLVLFYETFPTSYAYTRLGRIDNTAGLATALGAGSVTVTFEPE